MDPTKRFSDRVQDYVKYRPSYPDALIDYLIAYTGIPETATVADLGSGTGIFSGLLLERGFQVFGVEPNTKMRRASVSNLSDFPAYKAVNASAEKTTLDDQCADLITAAQSFHWFDVEKTRAEFARIAKPGAYAALIWNERTPEDPFQQRYEQLLENHVDAYAESMHLNIGEDLIRSFFQDAEVHFVSFDNQQMLDLTALKGRLLSTTYAPKHGQHNHSRVMSGLEDIFAEYHTNGAVAFRYNTNAFISRL